MNKIKWSWALILIVLISISALMIGATFKEPNQKEAIPTKAIETATITEITEPTAAIKTTEATEVIEPTEATETAKETVEPTFEKEPEVVVPPITETTAPIEAAKPTESIAPPAENVAPNTSGYDQEFIDQWGESATYIAKTVWGEARGVSVYGQEQVIWCILNRVDDSRFPNTIIGVITAPNQFHGYNSGFPCTDEMYKLALDVIYRWQLEKVGGESNRNLGPEYVYFRADSSGLGNVFRTHW